jgi:hypothetical protein
MPATLTISNLWNGADATDRERTSIALRWVPGGLGIEVDAPFYDDPAPAARPGPCDRLWNYEVVEIFLGGSAAGAADRSQAPYTEIELSPHGHYLVLRLLGVRNRVDLALPLAFHATIEDARWRGRAVVPFAYLPEGDLSGNAYAVHGVGPRRRYLAAHPLPGEGPDFHQPDRFEPLDLGPREAGAERRGC